MKGLLFTYALTYGGAVVSMFNPFYGLLIYICFAIIRPESLWYWSVPSGNYSRVIGIALLVGWAIHGFGDWNLHRARPIVYLLLAYFGWMILSASAADINPPVAWVEVESNAKIVLPFLAGISLIDSVRKLKQIAWVIMLSQGYVAYDLNQSFYAGFNRVHDVGFSGMDNNSVSISMVCGAGLAFFLGLGATKLAPKLIAFSSAVLMAHVPMFAMSRGGQLGLLVTGIVSFLLIPKRPKDYGIFALALAGGLLLAGPSVRERFATSFAGSEERDSSANSRLELWKDCWDVMQKNPLLGVGPAHWQQIAHTYGWTMNKSAHSVWFETGADMGIPGVGLLIAFYLVCIWKQWKLLQRPLLNAPVFTDFSRMVIAALVGFMVSASFVSLKGLELPFYIVLLGAGSLKVSRNYESSVRGPERWGLLNPRLSRTLN